MAPATRVGVPIRAIPLDVEVYATGLLAADRLPLDLIVRMRDALIAGYELQRKQPEIGITAFRRRYPNISEDHLRTGWSVLEIYAFDAPRPGSMDATRWETTIEYTAAAQGLSVFPAQRVYRQSCSRRPRSSQPHSGQRSRSRPGPGSRARLS